MSRVSTLVPKNWYEYVGSFQLEVYVRGKKWCSARQGDKYKYYDLASLTKPLFTLSALIPLLESGQVKLDDSLSRHMPDWPFKNVTIASLLNHTSGVFWWRPFYQDINLRHSCHKRWQELRELLIKEKPRKSQVGLCRYSDLNFLLLNYVLQEAYQCDLKNIASSLFKKVKLKSFHFNEGNQPKYSKSLYAPTERTVWRPQILQGEVNDNNTWSLGGVSTHSGLFGSVSDVSRWGLLLRKAFLHNKNTSLVSSYWAQKIVKRSVAKSQGDWALGLMMPSVKSTAGELMSKKSVGHLGYTGTSIWWDPKKDVLITLLANRHLPEPKNKKLFEFRRKIHNHVMKEVMKNAN